MMRTRNRMFRLTSSLIVLLLCLSLLGCSEDLPYDYDLGEYIKVGEYKGIHYDFSPVTVSDDEVRASINSDLKDHGYGEDYVITSGEVMLGDIVKIDTTGKINGVEDKAFTWNNYELEIGSGVFFDDFENGLIGKEICKTSRLSIKFPQDYISYAGQTAEFEIRIISVSRKKFPELTDAIVADISDQKTVEEYKTFKTEELKQEALIESEELKEQTIWETVVNAAKVIKYPEKDLERLIEDTREQFTETASRNGQTIEEYLAENSINEADFEAYLKERAKSFCKEEMVMQTIARKEGFEVSEKEIEKQSKLYMETYGYKSIKELYKSYSKGLVEQDLLYQKVIDFVVDNAIENS